MSAGTDMSAIDADSTLDNAAHGGCPATTCSVSSFRCIVADPPWHYGRSWGTGSAKAAVQTTKAEPMPYDQMKLDEIKALPVGSLAADDCDLYLWVTQKYLPDAFDVLKAWGFRYCQTLTWCKAPMGTGQGGLYCPTTEFLILGRRGKMPAKKRMGSTWWQVKRQKRHSQKPEFFQDLIESQSDGPRLELFARRKRLGWAAWGNEIASDVALSPQNSSSNCQCGAPRANGKAKCADCARELAAYYREYRKKQKRKK